MATTDTPRETAADCARQIAEPLARTLGLEVVEVEYGREGPRMVLRIFIDKSGGVGLEDCTALSHALGPALDVEGFPPGDPTGGYSLEVSSPGLERPLRKPADFRRFAGKKAQVKTFAKLELPGLPGRRTFGGTLLGCDDERVELLVDGARCAIPLSAIAKAHLVLEEDAFAGRRAEAGGSRHPDEKTTAER